MDTSSIDPSPGDRPRPAVSLRDRLGTSSQATLIALRGASIAFALLGWPGPGARRAAA